MENASKALIIAGAILISIILISIGIMVIQAGNGVIDQSGEQMDQQAKQAFNSQFANYSGTQRGSTVKSLLQVVMASNSSSSNPPIAVVCSSTDITGTPSASTTVSLPAGMTGSSVTPESVLSVIKPSSKYTIEIVTVDGLVAGIYIK